jgi:uncharacterized protein YifN (PemK superfamily)
MPHSIRVFKCLRGCGFSEPQSLSVASVIESAKIEDDVFDREAILDGLFDAGFTEPQAEALTDALRNCFYSQRFSTWFNTVALKTALVRAKITPAAAEQFLQSLDPAIVTARTAEPRIRIQHPPPAGRVVMCDFSFLRKPEMQKVRRAIVVARSPHSPGRCVVVPVSMTASRIPHPQHYEFAPRSYPFFHREEPVWATCDHVYTVALDRLWLVNIGRQPQPRASISADDLLAIRQLLGTFLGP